jgi:hypothetical protein
MRHVFGPCDDGSGFSMQDSKLAPCAEDIRQVLSIVLQDGVAHPQLAPLSVAFLVALLHGASRFELLSGKQYLEVCWGISTCLCRGFPICHNDIEPPLKLRLLICMHGA